MGWGVSGTEKSITKRTTSGKSQVQDMWNSEGKIIDQHTYGGTEEVTEEGFLAKGSAYANEAVDGQEGTSVVTQHDYTEDAQNYAMISKTTRKIPGESA